MSEVADLTSELVQIPSHENETEAGDYIEEWLREKTDAAVTRDESGNVIARKGQGESSLALVGHHDVVPPAESQTENGEYTVSEVDGRLYGRGTADMKGAVAAAMCSFRDADSAGELVFASFVGEETGGVGAQHAIQEGFSPDRAIVAEGSMGYATPGVLDVVVAHRGRRELEITAVGETAHAADETAGVNAIYRAVDAIDELRSLDAPSFEFVDGDQVIGSIVVTEIEGGVAKNVIPDDCSFTADERTVPEGTHSLDSIEALDGVSVEVADEVPPMDCTDEAFRDTMVEVASAVQEQLAQEVFKPHVTDASWLDQAGVECVVCGPAELGEAHTESESVSIAGLEASYDIYRGVAEEFA